MNSSEREANLFSASLELSRQFTGQFIEEPNIRQARVRASLIVLSFILIIVKLLCGVFLCFARVLIL